MIWCIKAVFLRNACFNNETTKLWGGHKPLIGKLGSLHVGKLQIGGILDWRLDLVLSDSARDATTYYKLSKWKLIAESYWLFDIPRKVIVRLYSDSGKGYWEGKGNVTPPTKQLWDTLVHEPIEIVGEEVLEGKE